MAGSGFDTYLPWLTAVFLMSLRVGPTLLATPLVSAANVPLTVRIALVLGLSGALYASLGGTSETESQASMRLLVEHPGALVQAAGTELGIGATLAVAIQLAFSAFSIAGRLLDIQVGFGLGQVFDPAFDTTLPILTTAFNQIAILVFFLVNGHHALLRALAYSLERLPLGRLWSTNAALAPLMKQVAGLFSLSFALVAPVAFCILLADLALGVISRNLPQMNMLTMGVPIKIAIGLVALSLWFNSMGPVMDRAYGGIYSAWDGVFQAEPGIDPAGTGRR